jgi:hypothetical protein
MDKIEIEYGNFLERNRITALNDKLVVEFKNLVKEYRIEYSYDELKPKVIRGKSGNTVWTTLGLYLLSAFALVTFAMVVLFREVLNYPYSRLLPVSLAMLAIIAFCISLIKYETVWFDDHDNNAACVIKFSAKNREHAEKMIDYITENINLASKEKPN